MPHARVLSTCTFPYSIVRAPFTTELLPAPPWEHSHRGEAKSQASHCKEEGATLGICKKVCLRSSPSRVLLSLHPGGQAFVLHQANRRAQLEDLGQCHCLLFFLFSSFFFMSLGSPTEVYGLFPFLTSHRYGTHFSPLSQ